MQLNRIPPMLPRGVAVAALAAALVAGPLPGCAVLTVDVDVYKGPLSTHPSLQLEQACGMVDGARLVLEQVRDSIRKDNPSEVEDLLEYPVRYIGHMLALYEDAPSKETTDQALRMGDAAVRWRLAEHDPVAAIEARNATVDAGLTLLESLGTETSVEVTAFDELSRTMWRALDPEALKQAASQLGLEVDADSGLPLGPASESTKRAKRVELLRSASHASRTHPLAGDVGPRAFERVAGYFDASRPGPGLNKVVREYRQKQDETTSDALIDVVTAFATRILAFTNAQPLLEPTQPGWFTDFVTDSWNNAVGADRSVLRSRAAIGSKYLSVMQAIGNELLAQVDAAAARREAPEQRVSDAFVKNTLRHGADLTAQGSGETPSSPPVAVTLAELTVAARAELYRAQRQLADAHAAAGDDAAKAKAVASAEATIRACEAAIRTADELRQSQVFILPAAAYLKSAVRTTRVQDGTAVGSKNELLGHAQRMQPLDALIPDGSAAEAEVRKELDRQSWQNINQVRVAAGGDTTYALVKDDVGNWYVKGFSGDPQPIIDGTTAIALRGFGAAHGLDAMDVLDGRVSATDAVAGSVRSKQLGAAQSDYFAQARRDEAALRRDFAEVADDLIAELRASAAFTKVLSPDLASEPLRASAERRLAAWTRTDDAETAAEEDDDDAEDAASDASKPKKPSKVRRLRGMAAVRSFHRGIGELESFAADARRVLSGPDVVAKGPAADAATADETAARAAGAKAVETVVDALVRRHLASRSRAREAASAQRSAIATGSSE